MHRILHIVTTLVAACSIGCAITASTQHRRDRKLRNYSEPRTEVAESLVQQYQDDVVVMPPAITPYQERLVAQDAGIQLHQAVAMALSHSGIVRVSRGVSVEASPETANDVSASWARIDEALAAFDASVEASFSGSKTNRPPNAIFGPGLSQPLRRDQVTYLAGLRKPLRTGGLATLFYNPDPGYFFIPRPDPTIFNPRHIGQLEFGIEQPLLRKAGLALNVIPIKISQLRTEQSAWDFKQAVMESVRGVCVAYWDLYAARAALTSVERVIPLLEEIVRLQEAAFTIEWVIEADVAKAHAQLLRYQEERLARLSDVAEVELRLRNLIGAPASDGGNLTPETRPLASPIRFDAARLLGDAMANQPSLVRQRLDVRLRKLELMQAENELLPNLDFVALYRMNGVGDTLGSAIQQLASAEFADWELGAGFSTPIGRRAAKAAIRAAQQQLIRDTRLLQQQRITVMYDLNNHLRRLEYSFLRYESIEKQLTAAEKWVEGSRLRYQNPNPEVDDSDALLNVLNDYLAALRFWTDAAADQAVQVAVYNSELIRLEETKGTLLTFFGIDFINDPCRQTAWFQPPNLPPEVPPISGEPQPPAQASVDRIPFRAD